MSRRPNSGDPAVFDGVRGLVRLCAAFALAVMTAACTVSGANFLYSNSESGSLEPYSYPGNGQTGQTITVTDGDTLYSLSKEYNVDLNSLIEANGLTAPYSISPGQRLTIPGPITHTVQRGETLYSISRAYSVDTMTLADMNGIMAPYALTVGQELQLPGNAKRSGGGKSGGLFGGKKDKNKKSSAGKTTRQVARATPRGGGRFLWPVHGTIISGFGAKGNGQHNDGINISVAEGTHVLATDDGTVTYVGNELRGYGNLILIAHRGGWVSAYAHNRSIWVQKGQAVHRGQHIANSGRTGDAERPQLHFELRRGPTSVDPVQYLNVE